MRRVASLGSADYRSLSASFAAAAEAFSTASHVARLQDLYATLLRVPSRPIRRLIREQLDARAPRVGRALRGARHWVSAQAARLRSQ